MKTQDSALEQLIQTALVDARNASTQFGPEAPETAVAWDIVEELEAEASHRRDKNAGRTAFTEYCEEFPDAFEARIYDN